MLQHYSPNLYLNISVAVRRLTIFVLGVFEGEQEYLLPWKYSDMDSYESMEANDHVIKRMRRAVNIILNTLSEDESALVVSHGNIIGRYIHNDVSSNGFKRLDNGSIAIVEYSNRVSYLKKYICQRSVNFMKKLSYTSKSRKFILCIVLLILFLLLFFCGVFYKDRESKNLQSTNRVDRKLKNFLSTNNINGLILVSDKNTGNFKVIENSVNYKKSFQVTESRYFPIASLQKIMTGILIYDLVKNNRISWNTRLSYFYPSIKNSNNIKIWQLMSHQSGIYDKEGIPKLPLNNENSRMSYIMSNFGVKDRQDWNYASSNYGVLAATINKEEKSYNSALERKLLLPYQLNEIKSPEDLQCNQVALPLKIYGKKRQLAYKIMSVYAFLLQCKGLNSNLILNNFSWLLLKDCLSPAFGAGDMLATPRNYWKLVTKVLLSNPEIINTFKQEAKKTEKGYFGGCYFRKNFCYASGNIGNYNCCCFAANLKSKKVIMFFTNNMNYLSLKKTQKYLYSIYFKENIYS
ncbi:Protein FmtA [Lactobacillus helveticus]|nr:serine hydrolase [Lactobacillus helveticus]NRN94708.1 Protein FmtA [Lactobacillus helveticus]